MNHDSEKLKCLVLPRWQWGPWVRMVLEQPVNDSNQAPSSINLRLHGTASKALPITNNNVGPFLIFDWPGPTPSQHEANTTRHFTRIITTIPRTTPKFHVSKSSVLDLKVTVKLVHRFAPRCQVIGFLIQLSKHVPRPVEVLASGFSTTSFQPRPHLIHTLGNSGVVIWVSDRPCPVEQIAHTQLWNHH